MSPASRATSVPLPMAKPTSAFFSAGASLTPSPVMPATRPCSCARRTSLVLSYGFARYSTPSRDKQSFASASESAANRAESSTRRPSDRRPHSRATDAAVSPLSPVTMTTCTPAASSARTAPAASRRTRSRIPAMHTSVSAVSPGVPSATARTRFFAIERCSRSRAAASARRRCP